jgi:hypothetical protein
MRHKSETVSSCPTKIIQPFFHFLLDFDKHVLHSANFELASGHALPKGMEAL